MRRGTEKRLKAGRIGLAPRMAAPEPTNIGRYEVVSRLGQGGMGSLYLAKDPKIGRLVAIKLVRQEFDSPDARQRFAREAQSAGTLRHPNIVTIFDVDEHEGLPFIAMEYIDGETLAEIVKRKALLPISKRIQWVEELCGGLAYAHRQGVIHRDIKPANLMVDTEGSLKILDFGLARRDASKFTQSHVIIGTPNYMSPEQIRGQNIDTRSDIFAVGAVFYEILTYKEAFPGAVHQTMHKILHEEPEPLETYLPDSDPALSKILSRAIVKDRDGRYPDLSAMRNDLSETRVRIESGVIASADSATMPLSKDARFQAQTQVTPTRGTTAPSSGSSRSGSSRASKRFQTNRQSLQKRRSEQITALLDEARRLFESGNIDKARDKCDEALMFDPDHPGGLQLMDDIAAESDRQQVAKMLADARGELQKGQLDRAEALVADARAVFPESADVQQLQDAIDTTRREIERTRQIQETMRRARARFAEGGYEAAIRAAGEVLAIDPENTQAKDLQTRAHDAIEQHKTRGERDAAAQAAVSVARKKFESGDKDGAIKELEAFQGKHDLVTGFLAQLKGEKVPEPEHTGGETAHILRGARGPTPDLPARRNFLIAGVSFAVIVIAATLYFQPWRNSSPPSQALNQPPATADAGAAATNPSAAPPAPAPLAPVAAPSALTEKPVQSQDDKDVLAVYALLTKNDIPGAQKIYAAIRKRNPKYEGLSALNTAIDDRAAEIKKQEDQIAEANAANARAAAALEEEKKKTAQAQKDAEEAKANAQPVMSTLPGGAFVAPSAAPTPELLGEVERPAIEKLVQQWAAALGTRNVATISNIRSFTEDEAKSWQNIYKNYNAVEVNATVTAVPEVKSDQARVQVQEIVVLTQKNGIKITQQPRNVHYRMHKVGGQWRMLPPNTPMPPAASQ